MKVQSVLIFGVGAVIGTGVGFMAAKKFYTERYDKDVEELRDWYADEVKKAKGEEDTDISKEEQPEPKAEVEKEENEPEKKPAKKNSKKALNPDKSSLDEYKEVVEKTNYAAMAKTDTAVTTKSTSKKKKTTKKELDISVIEPDEFAERNGYDKVTLTYFESEDIFIDDEGNSVDNGTELVGIENMSRFGEYEDLVLYVRNKLLEKDYEVIMETRSYDEYMRDEFGA